MRPNRADVAQRIRERRNRPPVDVDRAVRIGIVLAAFLCVCVTNFLAYQKTSPAVLFSWGGLTGLLVLLALGAMAKPTSPSHKRKSSPVPRHVAFLMIGLCTLFLLAVGAWVLWQCRSGSNGTYAITGAVFVVALLMMAGLMNEVLEAMPPNANPVEDLLNSDGTHGWKP